MNNLITTITFDKPRKPKLIITDDYIQVCEIRFKQIHRQDCCENVFADFKSVLLQKFEIEKMKDISKIELKSVKDMGFIIFLYETGNYTAENGHRRGILVNCYNQQNGYYSDELKLDVRDKDKLFGIFDLEKWDEIY